MSFSVFGGFFSMLVTLGFVTVVAMLLTPLTVPGGFYATAICSFVFGGLLIRPSIPTRKPEDGNSTK